MQHRDSLLPRRPLAKADSFDAVASAIADSAECRPDQNGDISFWHCSLFVCLDVGFAWIGRRRVRPVLKVHSCTNETEHQAETDHHAKEGLTIPAHNVLLIIGWNPTGSCQIAVFSIVPTWKNEQRLSEDGLQCKQNDESHLGVPIKKIRVIGQFRDPKQSKMVLIHVCPGGPPSDGQMVLEMVITGYAPSLWGSKQSTPIGQSFRFHWQL
jgi:hypothetical protein